MNERCVPYVTTHSTYVEEKSFKQVILSIMQYGSVTMVTNIMLHLNHFMETIFTYQCLFIFWAGTRLFYCGTHDCITKGGRVKKNTHLIVLLLNIASCDKLPG